VRKPGREPIIVNCFDQTEPASTPRRRRDGVPGKNKKFDHSSHSEAAAVFGGHWGARMSVASRLKLNDEELHFYTSAGTFDE
jgi:hypothetical protein